MQKKSRLIPIIIVLLIVLLLISAHISFLPTSNYPTASLPTRVTSSVFPTNHFFGGFSVTTSKMITNAAQDGIIETQSYNRPAWPTSLAGQTLQSSNVHEIDSFINYLLYEYECHRSKTVEPAGVTYCSVDYPSMSASALLSSVSSHLQSVRTNNLINAYWVLDDWPLWDTGSAKLLLQQIHSLIQRYTPGRPAICGFGAEFGYLHDDYWQDTLADNFSPQGCDMVGLYIYSAYISTSSPPPPSTDAFDWSMSTILPKMFTSLSQRGWNQTQEPFIGIGQAFSGTEAGSNYYLITPSVQNMATQALSFCQHGAAGVFFYAWDTGTAFNPAQTPMTSSQLQQGVQQGIAACKNYWQSNP